ncbi:MAG: hypothetical protein KIT19_13800 [Phycisphaeraceae bacterium]|nr:hypothetical protein [Phycisphaeraceae bacterium]
MCIGGAALPSGLDSFGNPIELDEAALRLLVASSSIELILVDPPDDRRSMRRASRRARTARARRARAAEASRLSNE